MATACRSGSRRLARYPLAFAKSGQLEQGFFTKEIEQARAYIAGLGWYELYLNGTKVGDNEGQVKVATACSQACPTQAITFGNIIDTSSNVAKLRSSGLNYGLLSELNTKPRTTYLGRVRNPNPELSQNQG